jgi:hypothetical protein
MRYTTLALALTLTCSAVPGRTAVPTNLAAPQELGANDFSFEMGDWDVHHRVKRAGGSDWIEFEGESRAWPLMDGLGNIEDNVFHKAAGIVRGVALRAFDPQTGTWAIWWVDGRNPHGTLDPPVRGRFVDGVGTFYSDSMLNGRPLRTRFIWSAITATSAKWEQAYSYDAGKSWDTNWIMQFHRRAPAPANATPLPGS